jgi:DNA polymerase-3 subunit gamma/tau
LALAPDEATGFSMTLLRLLAFEPAGAEPAARDGLDRSAAGTSRGSSVAKGAPREPAPTRREPDIAVVPQRVSVSKTDVPAAGPTGAPLQALPDTTAAWPAFVASLRLTGMAAQLAAQSELKSIKGNALSLAIPASHKHLADKAYSDKLKAALDAATGRKVLLAFEIGESGDGSLAALERRERAQAQAQGDAAFRNEPFVRDLVERFNATVRPDTVTPLATPTPLSKQEPS